MRRGLLVVALGAAALVLAAGGTAAVVLHDPKRSAGPPAATPTPEPTRTPLLAAAQPDAPEPTVAGLSRALGSALAAPALGGRVGVSVVDVATGATVLAVAPSRPATPASTQKIGTAVAALTALDPAHRITTRVVQGAQGDLVLVGGGDPTLAGAHAATGFPRAARLSDLARQLTGVPVRRVVVDDSLFTGPQVGPGWKPSYFAGGNVAPVSALEVDEGRISSKPTARRAGDPALEAGRQLARLLHVRSVVRGTAPADAKVLAHVDSPPVAELVEQMLTHSDNDLAEALGRQVALVKGQPASFTGEARALSAALSLPAGTVIADASGLSAQNLLEPAVLTGLLRRVATTPALAPVLTGLPVAGFDGTLANRYRKAPSATAAGEIRAKTGTLTGVSALAGLVRTRDGRLLAFAVTADRVSERGTLAAEAALDQVAAVLAGCGCR